MCIARLIIGIFIYSATLHARPISGLTTLVSNDDEKATSSSMRSQVEARSKRQVNYTIRKAILSDKERLRFLYQRVAAIPGGLARTKDEITDDYISKVVLNGVNKGLFLVVELEGKLIGAMVKYRLDPKAFSHILAEGSILVDPDFQGKGIGSKLITTFLRTIEEEYPHVLRVEIVVRESNPAIKLYEKIGFKKEGRFESKIRGVTGKLEADIPMVWINKKFALASNQNP